MREALQEARDYRDPTNEGGPGSGPQKGGKKFSDKQIKQAYGILNDPRYKQGNYSGASKAIDKLAPGLSNHPDVKNAMKRANETLDLPATGDTTTSNASQEDIVEKNINEVAPIAIAAIVARILGTTVAKNAGSAVKKALSTTPKVAKPVAVATTATAGAPTTTISRNLPENIENNEVDTTEGFDMGNIRPRDSMGNRLRLDKYPKRKVPIIKVPSIPVPTMNYVGSKTEGGPGSGPQKTNFKPLSKNHSSARATVSPSKAREIKKFLSDNGEKYPVAINDNGSGQITIDDDGEKGSSFAAGQAIAKKFGVKVMGEGNINEVKEASFSKGQMDALVKGFGPLGGSERNKIKMDKVAGILAKLPKDALMQLSKANLPMVSKVAKELMKEEIDEAVVGLPFSRTLMYIIKTDRNTATRIKSFLADNGEKYPIHVDDNGSGQITLDAYNYTGGEKKAALAAAQAIAKKFNVKVNATR